MDNLLICASLFDNQRVHVARHSRYPSTKDIIFRKIPKRRRTSFPTLFLLNPANCLKGNDGTQNAKTHYYEERSLGKCFFLHFRFLRADLHLSISCIPC